jgi:hypothetical protein
MLIIVRYMTTSRNRCLLFQCWTNFRIKTAGFTRSTWMTRWQRQSRGACRMRILLYALTFQYRFERSEKDHRQMQNTNFVCFIAFRFF